MLNHRQMNSSHSQQHHSKPMPKIQEIDLQRQKLQREIYELEKELKKQEKTHQSFKSHAQHNSSQYKRKEEQVGSIGNRKKTVTKNDSKTTTSHKKFNPCRSNSPLVNESSHSKNKQKVDAHHSQTVSLNRGPVVDQSWKDLFNKTQPYIYGEETNKKQLNSILNEHVFKKEISGKRQQPKEEVRKDRRQPYGKETNQEGSFELRKFDFIGNLYKNRLLDSGRSQPFAQKTSSLTMEQLISDFHRGQY